MHTQLMKEKQDLTYLSWSTNRNSLGIGGSFLKAYSELGGTKTYYMSSFMLFSICATYCTLSTPIRHINLCRDRQHMLPVFILRIGPFVPDTPTYRKSSDGWRLNPTPRESHPSEDLSELPPLVTTDHVPNPASTLNIMARQAYHCAHSRSWRCTDPLCTCS